MKSTYCKAKARLRETEVCASHCKGTHYATLNAIVVGRSHRRYYQKIK